MFKKIYRQKRTMLLLMHFCNFSIAPAFNEFPQVTDEPWKDDPDIYLRSRMKENIGFIEFKDNDENLNLKIAQLAIINKSRKKNNAEPVKLDILASRVANMMSREAADNKYIGHWNMAGEEPYLRYAFAGGYDHVSENAYGEWSSGNFNVCAYQFSDENRT
jgi:uncharacterized protein YkwD